MALRFKRGDRVRLNRADPPMQAGSPGTIDDVFRSSSRYDVRFDAGGIRPIPDSALDPLSTGLTPFGLAMAPAPTVGGRASTAFAECLAALPDFRSDVFRIQQEDVRGGGMVAFAARGAYSAFASPASNVHATGVGVRRRGGALNRDEAVLKLFVFDKIEAGAFAEPPVTQWRGMPVDVEQLPIQVVRAKRGEGGRGGPSRGKGRGGAPPRRPAPCDPRDRHRPIMAGVSISPLNAAFVGTLGCFLRRRNVDTDVILALSNNHVLADVDRLERGTQIVQPGPELPPFMTDPADAFATLRTAIPIVFPSGNSPLVVNRFDAAVATVNDVRLIQRGAMCGIDNYDPSQVVFPVPGMRVIKCGRTTSVTRGTVTAIRVDGVQVNYGTQQAPRIAVFDDTVEIEGDSEAGEGPFSRPGDSGSVILEEETGRPVALLFAGDGVHTTACELGPLCRRLRAWPI